MRIAPVDQGHADGTRALLGDLKVSLFGIQSRHLHARLVDDAIQQRIDGRIAVDGSDVIGLVIAAPAQYWWWRPLRDWRIAAEIAAARLARRRATVESRQAAGSFSVPTTTPTAVIISDRVPPHGWRRPGHAWRIVFVGTSPLARGRGVAAALYRQLMSERSLVARIALDNAPSLRLHASTGWSLHHDDGVVLAVHELAEPPQ